MMVFFFRPGKIEERAAEDFYNMPEMTAVFCKADDILYGKLPRAEFLYTQQIGTGGSMCDYTFKKR